jgi:hypothetical protein
MHGRQRAPQRGKQLQRAAEQQGGAEGQMHRQHRVEHRSAST